MVNMDIRNQLPDNAIIFDNHAYDEAIIGVTLDGRVIYDYATMVSEFMADEDCDEIDAIEWVDYNTIRSLSYAGSNAPLIVEIYY